MDRGEKNPKLRNLSYGHWEESNALEPVYYGHPPGCFFKVYFAKNLPNKHVCTTERATPANIYAAWIEKGGRKNGMREVGKGEEKGDSRGLLSHGHPRIIEKAALPNLIILYSFPYLPLGTHRRSLAGSGGDYNASNSPALPPTPREWKKARGRLAARPDAKIRKATAKVRLTTREI